ncbi:MAG: universal stress protein [Verrucomicrobia bacterium]|nr:universal stress protein [Verrucomicrobiota bacterium]
MNPTPPPTPGEPATSPSAAPPPFPPQIILVPLDFSARARKALRYAGAFARQFGSRLQLLHVTEPLAYPTDLGYAPVVSGELETELQEGSRERLVATVEEVRRTGVPVEGCLRVGRPHSEIAAAAWELKADLVVVTTHGFTGLKHVLLGSVAERVVRHAPCPVLVVREQQREFLPPSESAPGTEASPAAEEPLRLERLLVPVDFSEASRAALDYAGHLARQFQARLLLVHVTELPYLDAHLADVDTRAFEESTRQSSTEQLDRLVAAQRQAGLTVEGRLLTGAAWHETVRVAQEDQTQLIVAGTHGYTGLKHALLGSTAERIVRHAPCPVLVVRARPAPEPAKP